MADSLVCRDNISYTEQKKGLITNQPVNTTGTVRKWERVNDKTAKEYKWTLKNKRERYWVEESSLWKDVNSSAVWDTWSITL